MFRQIESTNQHRSHLVRNIVIVVLIIVILSISLIAVANMIRSNTRSLPAVNTIVKGLIAVNSSTFKVYPFTFHSDVSTIRVDGTFAVQDYNGSGIKVYIMDSANFVNWQNGDTFGTYYGNEEAKAGDITANLTSVGTYFLVYDNTFSATSKIIDTNAYILIFYED
jgi:hypothetical protein